MSQVEFILRGKLQPRSDPNVRRASGEPAACFKELLAVADFPSPEPVIEWEGVEDLAALDVDFHAAAKPTDDDLAWWGERLHPAPEWYWTTHGRGFRGIFTAAGVFTAEERAALYGLHFRDNRIFTRAPVTGVEIKTETRHPGYPRDGRMCGSVHTSNGSFDAEDLCRKLLGAGGDADADRIDGWLEDRGFERGRAYEHDRCPIAPEYTSHGNPVWIGEHGINCLSCAGRGLAYNGCRKPGFVPYTVILDPSTVNRVANPLRQAVRGMCHWTHAKHVVEAETRLTGPQAELVYRALLKLQHLSKATEDTTKKVEKLIGKVFFPPVPIVRGQGLWVHPSDLATAYAKDGLAGLVRQLPAVQYVSKDAGVGVDPVKFPLFLNNGDLTDYGYPAVKPIRGIDFGWRTDRPESVVWAVVPANPPFRYYADPGMPWVESHLAAEFPGVRLDVLKLLVAAKGICQTDPPEPPRVMIVGQSGSAKTAHVLLAAELACDSVCKLDITPNNRERFKQMIAKGSVSHGYVFLDEIAKAQSKADELAGCLLSLTRDAGYHELYIGNRPMPRMPVLVMADTLVPQAMRADVQLARRIVLIDMGAGILATGKSWQETCITGEISGWRAFNDENQKAADMLVSWVKQNCRGMTFDRLAAHLGFRLLKDGCGEGIDPNAAKRELFAVACRTPDTKDATWQGRGWKVFDVFTECDLSRAFHDALPNGGDHSDKNSWQELTGAQWGSIIDRPGVELDIDRHSRKIGLRFRIGNPRSPEKLFNAEILTGATLKATT